MGPPKLPKPTPLEVELNALEAVWLKCPLDIVATIEVADIVSKVRPDWGEDAIRSIVAALTFARRLPLLMET
jgi:hypothetical protein